ncbi:hypothetical protein QE197_21705 (plasmid) [Arsenophonus nasoniae]|uniref:Uncharacterized protein n=1 Tax=Arsenophonus nasoniae TaxID=638 RepID=A0A4P7L526_9GAMM|nr:hypothetical protein [Arsenophonus nasoniae]QBY46130.1 hypothetical protein ArsFIN_47410 [Arsenophonus nasoniae]WGM13045.1 hypothetical protein QE197_21705 [Arsenophonus nasoniae]
MDQFSVIVDNELTERLAAQLMKPIKKQIQDIYQQVILLKSAFKD